MSKKKIYSYWQALLLIFFSIILNTCHAGNKQANENKRVEKLRKSNRPENADNQYKLGLESCNKLTTNDLKDAYNLFNRATSASHPYAIMLLGLFYLSGIETEQNFESAMIYFDAAKNIFNQETQSDGLDRVKAYISLCELATKKTTPEEFFNSLNVNAVPLIYGTCFEYGIGRDIDEVRALKYKNKNELSIFETKAINDFFYIYRRARTTKN